MLDAMAPEYADRVNIVMVIDREDWDSFKQYKIMTVPTQIFFDAQGNAVMTHNGVLSREAIVAQFQKMGVE